MHEHPIIFSSESVRAILAGTKSQTRRVIKPQPTGWRPEAGDKPGVWYWCGQDWGEERRCPFIVGQRLWVREIWDFCDRQPPERNVLVYYSAGGSEREVVAPTKWNPTIYNYERWRPSIHMPRWASRITLELTAVRAERLQDITEDDAIAEGIEDKLHFSELWDTLNAIRGYGWATNPWCWCISFRSSGDEVRTLTGA